MLSLGLVNWYFQSIKGEVNYGSKVNNNEQGELDRTELHHCQKQDIGNGDGHDNVEKIKQSAGRPRIWYRVFLIFLKVVSGTKCRLNIFKGPKISA